MNRSAKRIARLALLTALASVLLFFTGIMPAGRLGLMILASLPVAAALMQYGIWWSVGVYAVVSLVSSLLFFGDAVMGFVLFFGYFPIVKSLLERIHSRLIMIAGKAAVYCAAFFACRTFASSLFSSVEFSIWILFFAGAIVYFLYDWCYSLAIRIYIEKIARFIHD